MYAIIYISIKATGVRSDATWQISFLSLHPTSCNPGVFAMLKKFILGNSRFQPFFELLYKISYKGMNYDRGHVPESSGEEFVLSLLQKSKQQESLMIFDVGANVGQYGQLVMHHLKVPFVLHSFEPQKNAFAKLERISDKNNFHPHNTAVGAEEGHITMFYDNQESVFASVYKATYETYKVDLTNTVEVPVTTIDAFCHSNKVDRIDFLKIDAEGHELEILKGARQKIADGKIGMIQFEFGIASIEARIYLKDFFMLLPKYDIYRILQNGIRKLAYSEYIEIFLPTNYLAILKK